MILLRLIILVMYSIHCTMTMVLTFENIYYTVGGGSWVRIQEKDPATFDNFGGLTVLVDGEAQVVESQRSRLLQYFWLIV